MAKKTITISITKEEQEAYDHIVSVVEDIEKQTRPAMEAIWESAQSGLNSYLSEKEMFKSLSPIHYGYNRFNNSPDSAARSSLTIYLFYDKKSKIIRRNIDGTDIFYPFHKVGNAKRLSLFEILLEERGYVETGMIADKLKCPTTKAVGTMVRNFNIYAREVLQLDEKTKLVEGLEGHGYRINPAIKVIYE